MALQKSKQTPQGISIDYHKISKIFIDRDKDACTIHMEVFIDKVSRDAGNNPFLLESYTIPFSSVSNAKGDLLLSQVYTELKNLDAFSDAIDV